MDFLISLRRYRFAAIMLIMAYVVTGQPDLLNVLDNGNVGIGISNPIYPLDMSSNQGVIRLVSSNHTNGSVLELKNNTAGSPTFLGAINFNNASNGFPGQIAYTLDNNLTFRVSGSERMRINPVGNLGIGTSSLASGYRISVAGKIICEELKVQLQGNWPDFVFDEDYRLKPLTQLENEIRALGHLPGMPSAKEVENTGIVVGEMNKQLLQKVEELTLYVIDLQKQNQYLFDQMQILKQHFK